MAYIFRVKSVLNFKILKESRTSKHLSLGTLSYMVGDQLGKKISRQALHAYESGKNTPSVEVLKALLEVLEINPKDLLAGRE
jgi:predicted transcriptional regulator